MAKLQYRTISKRTVDGLSVDDKDAVFWDRELTGFGVRVYPSGSKVYVVQTRAKGKSKRVTLGRHGVISADQARRKAAETIARIKSGEDPGAKPASTVTVTDVAARCLKEHVALHCKSREGRKGSPYRPDRAARAARRAQDVAQCPVSRRVVRFLRGRRGLPIPLLQGRRTGRAVPAHGYIAESRRPAWPDRRCHDSRRRGLVGGRFRLRSRRCLGARIRAAESRTRT